MEGGRTISYPINAGSWFDIPLFIRRGAILTTQDVVPSIGTEKLDRLYLDVFPDAVSHRATVYDDDGETYAYEGDGFFKQRISDRTDGDGIALTVTAREGGYEPAFHYYIAKIHGRAAQAVMLNDAPLMEMSPNRRSFFNRKEPGPAVKMSTAISRSFGYQQPGVATLRLRLSGNHPIDTDIETIEAEDGSFSGETVDTRLAMGNDHAGFSGRGYADGFSHPHAAVTLSVKRRSAGTYAAAFRALLINMAIKRSAFLLNGVRLTTLNIPTTSDWDHWRDVPVTLPLFAGNNIVTLSREPSDTGGVNVDCLKVPFVPAK